MSWYPQDTVMKCIFLKGKFHIYPNDTKSTKVQAMAWHHAGYKPLPLQWRLSSTKYLCITRTVLMEAYFQHLNVITNSYNSWRCDIYIANTIKWIRYFPLKRSCNMHDICFPGINIFILPCAMKRRGLGYFTKHDLIHYYCTNDVITQLMLVFVHEVSLFNQCSSEDPADGIVNVQVKRPISLC